MKTTQINLGEYQYICELYKNGIDFNDINYKSQFIMLRRFEIYNDIVYDKDIFFIDKKIYNSLEKNTFTDKIVYPLHDSKQVLKFSNLGELYSYYNMSSIEDFKYDIKCDSTNDYIQCDKLRIYNPTIKNDLEYIVYVNNYINDIHFHYICNLSNNYEKKYEKEFEFNHHKYVEFIEIKLPSIDFLFDRNNKVYFTEDFNKIKSTNNITNYYARKQS